MAEKDPVLLERLQRAYDAGPGHRSSARRWMTAHFDEIKEMFDGRMDWVWLTAWFQENGFRNADGSALKSETLRKTWRRLSRDRFLSTELEDK
jgi:hypothetical protein